MNSVWRRGEEKLDEKEDRIVEEEGGEEEGGEEAGVLIGRLGAEIGLDVVAGSSLLLVGVGRVGEDVVISGARLVVGDADKSELKVGSIVVLSRLSVVRLSGMGETSVMELRISSRSG